MKSKIIFVDENLKLAFEKLKDSKTEDKSLYKWICRAFEDLEENAFCGIRIRRKLNPKEYIKKFGVENLWKYDLPSGWRLFYSVGGNKISVLSIILEWMTHKDYVRRFGY